MVKTFNAQMWQLYIQGETIMKYKLKRSNVSQRINNKFLTSQTYV